MHRQRLIKGLVFIHRGKDRQPPAAKRIFLGNDLIQHQTALLEFGRIREQGRDNATGIFPLKLNHLPMSQRRTRFERREKAESGKSL